MAENPIELTKENIHNILNEIDTILLDCDGVIWGGSHGMVIIDRSNSAIDVLQKMGKRIFLVTNNSTRSQETYHDMCQQLKINVQTDHVISAPYIMGRYLRNINFKKKVYVIGSVGLSEELSLAGIECIGPKEEHFDRIYNQLSEGTLELDSEVGAVVVGFDRDFNYDKLVIATTYLTDANCLFIANNIDKQYPVLGTKYNLPAAGVLVKAIEVATDREATVVGKPSRLMFDTLAQEYNIDPSRALMVGDTLFTDIKFGNTCGMKTLLVLSGVTNLEQMNKTTSNNNQDDAQMTPQYFISSLGHILDILEN